MEHGIRLLIQNPDETLESATTEQELQRIEERASIQDEMSSLKDKLKEFDAHMIDLNAILDVTRTNTLITNPYAVRFMRDVAERGHQWGASELKKYEDDLRWYQAKTQSIVKRLDTLQQRHRLSMELTDPYEDEITTVWRRPSLNLFRAAQGQASSARNNVSSQGSNSTATRGVNETPRNIIASLRTSLRENAAARQTIRRAREAARRTRADNTHEASSNPEYDLIQYI